MKFPHTVTIFNKIEKQGKTYYRPTVIRGCLNRTNFSYPKSTVGVNNGSTTALYIPLSADAGGKCYIAPDKYRKLDDQDRNDFYTFCPIDDYYIVGIYEADEPYFIRTEDIKALANIHKITAAELLDFGSKSLWHWEVKGE